MKSLRALTGIIVLLAAASPTTAQVIPGPRGPVEFIGLQDWKAQELFDAIQELYPGRPFSACAAVMKMELGFADAGAFSYRNLPSGSHYTVVVGVEDSTRVRHRTPGNETVALPENWQMVKTAIGDDLRLLSAVETALPSRGGFLDRVFNTSGRVARRMRADSETLDRVWDFIDGADGEEDRRLAHEILARDESWSARAVATLVLVNFGGDDTSWHALAASLVDPHARVSSAARGVLGRLIKRKKTPVEWSDASAPLSAILAGTRPFVFRNTLEVLVATDVDPEFGAQLVREEPELLLAYAGAEHEWTREPVLAFLRAVSGEDFGADVEALRAWMDGGQD